MPPHQMVHKERKSEVGEQDKTRDPDGFNLFVGGLPLDIPPGWDKKVLTFCDVMSKKLVEYEELLTNNRIWLQRTKQIGVISAEEAIAIGLSGPALRGSGVKRDIRKDEPYAAYDEMAFEVPVGKAGDTYDRYLVRLEEFRQSIRIIQQAIEGLPEGPIIGLSLIHI